MGIAELDEQNLKLIIHAKIFCYGNAATQEISEAVAHDIETQWNYPEANVYIDGTLYRIEFSITGEHSPNLKPEDVYYNTNPLHNYFRIENEAQGNISYVDGLGSNTGYFKLDNLLNNSTTAAHEFGHSLGLDHPQDLDIRGKGVAGIMYPRGTLTDPQYQYDPKAEPGAVGGTLNPFTRKVRQHDIDLLRLGKLKFKDGHAVVGEFSSRWHQAFVG